MKRATGLAVVVSFLVIGCTSLPKYSPYKSDTNPGFWESSLATDVYQVFAKLPGNVSESDRDHYLMLRIAELCEAAGYKYFHNAETLQYEDVFSDGSKKFSLLGFCIKEALRPSLNVSLDSHAKVLSVINPVTSNLRVNDVVQDVAGSNVKDLTSVKLALHKAFRKGNPVSLKVSRDGKSISVIQPIELNEGVWGPNDYQSLKRKFQ